MYPTVFKIAKVISIYKSNYKDNISNYRPILLLNVCSKILDKLVKEHLPKYLECHNILCEKQYGFRSGKNIADALFDLMDAINDSLASNNKVLFVFLDFEKALASIDRSRLLKKISFIGIRGNVFIGSGVI